MSFQRKKHSTTNTQEEIKIRAAELTMQEMRQRRGRRLESQLFDIDDRERLKVAIRWYSACCDLRLVLSGLVIPLA